jgi:hypothetical protein
LIATLEDQRHRRWHLPEVKHVVHVGIMNDLELTDAEHALREYAKKVGSMRVEDLDLLSIEEEVRALVEARAREVMAVALKRADTDAPEVEIDGYRWGNRRLDRCEYRSMFGTVAVERSTYQRAGGGRVAVPLDLRLGMVEGRYTPKMARVLTHAIAITTEDEGAAFLAELGTAVVSSSTLSRIPRSIAARYETRRAVVDARLREREAVPDDAVTAQVALDGVMVPQDGEHARPRGRKTDSPEPPRYEKSYGVLDADAPASADGHGGRSWHEASVGTIAYFDASGRRLRTIYLGRMPEPNKATLVGELNAEVDAMLSDRPSLNLVFASDGAQQHWAVLDAMAERVATTCTGDRMKLADAFHVAEYVQQAAIAIEGDGTPDASILSATWRETIKEREDGAESVLRSMRARRARLGVTARKDLDAARSYIATQYQLGRMKYAEAREKNYPIGTGITEAAAKTVVGTRMKRAGARFSQHGGQTIMLFRTALLSDRFKALHTELAATYRAIVRTAA